jgi:hypothetical protein
MRLRFVQTTPSDRPDFPFQPGQIIVVTKLTPEMLRWIKEGRAMPLDDAAEAAALGEPAASAISPPPARRRGSRS